jgi:hypothetical protein
MILFSLYYFPMYALQNEEKNIWRHIQNYDQVARSTAVKSHWTSYLVMTPMLDDDAQYLGFLVTA